MKEWLKVKWVFAGLIILHGAALLVTYFDLANLFKSYKANEVIIQFITFEVVYYTKIKYVALLSGLGIGIFQYFPELNQSRLKLTMHLPVKEHLLIIQMALTGISLLAILFLIDAVSVSYITAVYLPSEFFVSMITTTIPWYLGGLTAYAWVMIVFIEPSWRKRILLSVVGLGIGSLFYVGSGFNMYISALWYIASLTVISCSIIFLSAYNFKRGIL